MLVGFGDGRFRISPGEGVRVFSSVRMILRLKGIKAAVRWPNPATRLLTPGKGNSPQARRTNRMDFFGFLGLGGLEK
jgi:hypothetical protein